MASLAHSKKPATDDPRGLRTEFFSFYFVAYQDPICLSIVFFRPILRRGAPRTMARTATYSRCSARHIGWVAPLSIKTLLQRARAVTRSICFV